MFDRIQFLVMVNTVKGFSVRSIFKAIAKCMHKSSVGLFMKIRVLGCPKT